MFGRQVADNVLLLMVYILPVLLASSLHYVVRIARALKVFVPLVDMIS